MMTLQAVQGLPLEATPGGRQQGQQYQELPSPEPPNHTGMVVSPSSCADEVSVITFSTMGASAAAGSTDNSNASKYQHGQEDLEEESNEDDSEEEEEVSLSRD